MKTLIISLLFISITTQAHEEQNCLSPELSNAQATICMLKREVSQLLQAATFSINRVRAKQNEICLETQELKKAIHALEAAQRDLNLTRDYKAEAESSEALMMKILTEQELAQRLKAMKSAYQVLRSNNGCLD